MSETNRLDYPFIIAHFYMETDTGVFPVVPTAENMAAMIAGLGFLGDIDFIAPDGTKLAVSDGDTGIRECFDQEFLSKALQPALDKLLASNECPDWQEAQVDPDEWDALYEQYYDGPYTDPPTDEDDLVF